MIKKGFKGKCTGCLHFFRTDLVNSYNQNGSDYQNESNICIHIGKHIYENGLLSKCYHNWRISEKLAKTVLRAKTRGQEDIS